MKKLIVSVLLLLFTVSLWGELPSELKGFDWQDWDRHTKILFIVGFSAGTEWTVIRVAAGFETGSVEQDKVISYLDAPPNLTIGDTVDLLDAFYKESYMNLVIPIGKAFVSNICLALKKRK